MKSNATFFLDEGDLPFPQGSLKKRPQSKRITDLYRSIRAETERLAAPLSAEDQTIQSMPDASPTKWHRAHTTWFFETFILEPFLQGYSVFDPAFNYLFNSYYEAIGPRHPRPSRGLLSRPGMDRVADYRVHVDRAMECLLETADRPILDLIILGLNHEQQHQELLLTDIKHAFSRSPLFPIYKAAPSPPNVTLPPKIDWWPIKSGLYPIGHDASEKGFAFDNEMPRHTVFLEDYALADRPVSNGEYRAFMDDGGYERPEFWLSDGWAIVQAEHWDAPAYWRREGSAWQVFTLHGMQDVRDDEPVCHVSYFEAAAYALWAGCRLPREHEWEVAARRFHSDHEHTHSQHFHPASLTSSRQKAIRQDVWEWTASAYAPYPGYHAEAGALGEYNGKFMINQMVLRGRSCATPVGHDRITYRNFFPPQARWQFSGFRLAKDR
ncbi:ergothioneine biosynthesis protein EgtB [Beijerinckia indica]|uniref:Ergothioneine biosynthesis protein EgtB n=1 Tax=Beijerinckia indica subsp. indica (strain ATCC 9039 / DSM 1715 / NCIMB 8712) TaxID=395963 RepID=B2ID60_BEII9|nr:ergothioneine biosynthesis protein EgtB [Beijerinckia indica]ACB96825.1 protein of unknown function DUF323 [Beijerinckia indica subsp. indica ATCC 9039]